jgi:hypothetical protein
MAQPQVRLESGEVSCNQRQLDCEARVVGVESEWRMRPMHRTALSGPWTLPDPMGIPVQQIPRRNKTLL